MIQLHRLEGFYWVARERGYARAARAFPYPITQPAVHQQVKKLETELGLALFERLAKDRLGLTPAGQALFEFVSPFFERLPSVLRQIRAGEVGGELVIGSEPLLLRHLLPGWLRRFQRKRPDAVLDLIELSHANPKMILDGEVDALVAWLPEIPDGLAYEVVARIPGFLVLPAGHPAAKKKSVQLSDLADETFVGYHRDSRFFTVQQEALNEEDIEPRRMIGAGSAETILGLVAGGMGYSLIPWVDEKGPKLRGVVARPIRRARQAFPIYLAWRKDTPENPLLDAFIETAPPRG
jgi:LysR family transcriptional regulator, benzoate and cis,cis-muconate-responsive activator of ben and cat genes